MSKFKIYKEMIRKWVTTGLPGNCAKKALKAKVEEIVAAFHEAYYSEKAIAGSEANTAEETPKIILGNNKVYEFTEYLTYRLESTKPSISYNTYIGNLNKVRQYFDEKYPHIRLSEVKALPMNGQPTSQPIEIAISGVGISLTSLLYCVCSMSMP